MPRIPTFRRQRLPSTNVGEAPVTADVAIGSAEFQGLAQLGQGTSSFAQSLAKIGKANRDSKDSLAEIQQKKNDQEMDDAITDFKFRTGDTGLWEPEINRLIVENTKQNSLLEWGNETTKARADLIQSGLNDVAIRRTQINAVTRNIILRSYPR